MPAESSRGCARRSGSLSPRGGARGLRRGLETGFLGIPTGYAIKDGRIVTFFGTAPFEMTVYKMGDKHLAAQSNEFGFANYEIIPQPHALDPLGPAPLFEPKRAPKPPARGSKS